MPCLVAELFASSFPTVVLYVLDTPRCTSPQSFMSNMLQAVSILYKTKLPMILVRGFCEAAAVSSMVYTYAVLGVVCIATLPTFRCCTAQHCLKKGLHPFTAHLMKCLA